MEGERMISVDCWTVKSQAYFLTHLHADHTRGLSPEWAKGPVFLSPVSARLFPTKFPGFDTSLLQILELGVTRIIPLVSANTGLLAPVEVTPIDACHCPGSTMYLFRGEFGCVLHSGDYRWETTDERAKLAKDTLLSILGGDRLDVLYLDNTYCHPSFSFPPRNMAAKQAVDIISSHPTYDIVIGIDTLGKEDLLIYISQALKTKIWVWPERLQTMHLLGLDDIFTTRTRLTRVRAVPRYSLTVETIEALNTRHPTIGIMPSGLICDANSSQKSNVFPCTSTEGAASGIKLDGGQPGCPRQYHRFAYSVAYSTHSCFSEICELVKLVRPLKISGLVSSSVFYINPGRYFRNSAEDNAMSNQIGLEFRRSELGKRLRSIRRAESQKRHDASQKGLGKKDRTAEVAQRFGVRRSRVSMLRRERRGVKLVESDDASGSHLGNQ